MSIRPETTQILELVGQTIDLDKLLVEGTQPIGQLLTVIETTIFDHQGGQFQPNLHLMTDESAGIDSQRVARDQRKVELYTFRLLRAIETIDALILAAEKTAYLGDALPTDFPNKTAAGEDLIDRLSQLRALVQSYLDLFAQWQTEADQEVVLPTKEAVRIIKGVEASLNEVLIGQEQVVRQVMIALFSGGHVLLESLSGLGKTTLAKSMANVLGLQFARIQCTPDLMPTDILGTPQQTYNLPNYHRPPIDTNILLADEINRATPKTQSALLEAMAEGQVTNGRRRDLPKPFFVIATQNASGSGGTFPLPDAQLDRFAFKIMVETPKKGDLALIISQSMTGRGVPRIPTLTNRKEVRAIQRTIENMPISPQLLTYVEALILNTQPDKSTVESVKKYIQTGALVRAGQTIIQTAKAHALLNERTSVSIADIHAVTKVALQHRLKLKLDGLTQGITVTQIIDEIIQATSMG